jgi:tetratricopeptide (TPR) repeat protein
LRRKFEELRENLEEFVQQDEYPMLVVGCLAEELAYVLQFFKGLGEPHPEHFLVFFPQPFHTPHGYLDGVVESVRLQVEAAGPLRAERGEPPFPPLPPELDDTRQTPEKRLFATLMYLRTLLPNEEQHRVIVGLLPLECTDRNAYIRLLGSVMPVTEVPPWMGALRIVAYDDRRERSLLEAMRKNKVEKVVTFEVDFSTPALTDSLTKDAADTTLPTMERMMALLQLAALDYSYKRYQDAIDKYGVLYTYFEGEALPAMQAMCLLGVGDVMRAVGNLKTAKETYQRGIALAMEHKALPPLLNLLLSITDCCLELQHYPDAASYAESGTKVAAGVLNPYAYCDLHEKWGQALVAQNKLADGIAILEKARELCQMYEYFHRWGSVLERKIALFRDARMSKELREAEDELRGVRELERRGGSGGAAAHAHGGH